MENSADEIMRRKILVIGAGVGLFIVVVIFVWILSNVPHHTANVNTVNADTVISESGLSERNIADAERAMRSFLENYYGDKEAMKGRLTMTVRPESVKKTEEKAEFLVDIEELRLTYRARLNTDSGGAVFSCAELLETKYKGSFCVGLNGESTIGRVFGAALPIKGQFVEQMGMGLEERVVDIKRKNYKMAWEMRVSSMEVGENENPDGSARPYLIITAETCEEDEKYIMAAKDYVDTFIKEMERERGDGRYNGITGETFNYKVECKNG